MLDLVPGVSQLIDWLLKSEGLLVHLRDLVLSIGASRTRSNYQSGLGAVGTFFERCSSSVESLELRVRLDEYSPDLGNQIILMYTIYLSLATVPLHILRNLKKLVYRDFYQTLLLRYAVGQLQEITSSSGLLEVTVTLGVNYSPEDKQLCRALDGILGRDIFSSLKSVFTPKDSFCLFPKLCSAGLLKDLWGDRRKEYV